jgi:putative chitinase
MRAVDVVRKIAKKARPEYVEAFENGDALLSKAGINSPLRLAHFLAQVMHESGGLTVTFENMNYKAARIMQIFGQGVHSASITPSEAQHLAGKPSALAERVYGIGNPKKSREFSNTKPGDGYRYRGGGIMQTTGKSNYRRMGQKCGVDFEANPALVCTAEHALKPALAEWTEGKLNVLADRSDLNGITRKINGGYNGLEDRKAWFKKIRPLIDEVDFEFKPETVKPAKAPPDVEDTSVVSVDGSTNTKSNEIEASAERDVETSGSWLKRKWKWLTGTVLGTGGIGAVSWFDYRVVLALGGIALLAGLIALVVLGPGWVRAHLRKQVS